MAQLTGHGAVGQVPLMNCTIDWTQITANAPAHAGDLAYRLFCRPRCSPYFPADYKKLASRARVHLARADWQQISTSRGPIQTYRFEPDMAARSKNGTAGRNILLVHGWTSEAAFMSAFIGPLRAQGHRLVLFDLPAHGRSFGRRANLIDLAHAILAVADAMGPFDTVIAHSMGGLAALLAGEGAPPLPHGAELGRYILIASPNRLKTVTLDFGNHLGLGTAAQFEFERRLERVGHRTVASCEAGGILRALAVPALIVHSKDDPRVAFQDAQVITGANPMCELAAFDHLGHANVLFAPPVVRRVRDFCKI